MPIFTAIASLIANALFVSAAAISLATSVIAGGLAFAANLAISYLNRPKKRQYTAVQGETKYGGDIAAETLYGIGKTKGQRIYYAKYGKGNQYNAEVFALANGWCDGLEPYVYLFGGKKNLVPVTMAGTHHAAYHVEGYGGNILILFFDGRPGQQTDSRLVAETLGTGQVWKQTSRLSNICYVTVIRAYNADLFPQGKPDFEFVLRGLREFDPRKDSTIAGGSGPQRLDDPATWVFTQNPAVHRFNYQLGLRAQISSRTLVGEGKSIGQMDLGTYFVAMNVCDTIRNNKPTYQCGLWANGNDDHTEILKEFDDAMAGYGLNRRGLAGVIAGAPQFVVTEIGPDDLDIERESEYQFKKSAFERYNHLSGQFTSIADMWNPQSLKPIYVNADIAADGRSRQTSNDFLHVTDPDIAQYLLTIRYRQQRMGGTATIPVSRRVGLQVQEGEWVEWNDRTWMIEEWRIDEAFKVTLKLSETSADIYENEGIVPGPVVIPSTPQINPSILSSVQNFKVEAGVVGGSNGESFPALRFTWDPPGDPTITALRIFYRRAAEVGVEYHVDSTDPESGLLITSKDVVSGTVYNARALISTFPDRFKQHTPWVTTITATPNSSVLNGSVTASKLADAAVTADKLMNEAVTNIKLAAEAVSPEKLQNNAVTAQKLAAGAVEATKFAAGIQPVTIVEGGSLPGTKLTDIITFDGKSYTWNGTEYVGPDFNIGPGSITGDKIANAAINADKLAHGAVTHDKIVAGAIYGDLIAAQSITARELVLTDYNNIVDNGWQKGIFAGWEIYAHINATGSYLQQNTPPHPSDGYLLYTNGRECALSSYFAVSPGEAFNASAWVLNRDAATAILVIAIGKANGEITEFFSVASTTLKDQWVHLSGNYTIPPGYVTARLYLLIDKSGPNDNQSFWSKPTMRRAANAQLIVDGSISAVKIQAASISADKLAANSISARELILTDFSNIADNGWQKGNLSGWQAMSGFVEFAYGGEGDAIGWYGRSTAAYSQFWSSPIAVSPGEQYYLDAWVYNYPESGQKNAQIWLFGFDADGVNVVNTYADGKTAQPYWQRLKGIATVPAGVVSVRMALYCSEGSGYPGLVWSKPVMRRAAGAELIVDGSITAVKIQAGSISADRLVANSITAVQIAVGAIGADQIAANAITTSKLAAGAVTAEILAVGTGRNWLKNSDFSAGMTGWGVEYTNLPNNTWSISLRTDTYGVLPYGSLQLYSSSTQSDGVLGVTPLGSDGFYQVFACAPGQWLELSGRYYGHSVGAFEGWVQFLNANGDHVGFANAVSMPGQQNGNPNSSLANYLPFFGKALAPADAARCRPFWRFSTIVGGQPHLWLKNLFFGLSTAAQASATPWSDGSTTIIESGNIATNAVTASKILAGSVTAEKIAASSITGEKIVGASITARELLLTDFSNIIGLGWARGNLSGWAFPEGLANFYNDINKGWTVQCNGRDQAQTDAAFPVQGGQTYTLDTWVYNQDPAAAIFTLVCFDANSNVVGYPQVATNEKNYWFRLTAKVVLPLTTVVARPALIVDKPNGSGGAYCFWANPTVRRAYGAELIVDGSITANHIAANSITADKLQVTSLAAISANLGNVNIENAIIGNLKVGASNIDPGAVSIAKNLEIASTGGGTYDFVINHGSNLPGAHHDLRLEFKFTVARNGTGSSQFGVVVNDLASGTEMFGYIINLAGGTSTNRTDFKYYGIPTGRTSTTFRLQLSGASLTYSNIQLGCFVFKNVPDAV